jgi:tetratricopeptide (TPR) repeat protein
VQSPASLPTQGWEQRSADLWRTLDDREPAYFVDAVAVLGSELPSGHPVALFELGAANDSTGRAEMAEPLYRQALAGGLTGPRRRRAVIQLASTLRNLGRVEESVALLTAERGHGSDELDDAVAGFLALALADTGREREALALALAALAAHLPRYNRSLAAYARDLTRD